MAKKFGGIWTQQKLAVLEAYLRFYVKALKNQKFTLHYADAFAGSGSYQPVVIDGQEELIPLETFRGSVLISLDVSPGFDHYHFNDLDPESGAALEEIKAEHPGKQIHLSNVDANLFVADFLQKIGDP